MGDRQASTRGGSTTALAAVQNSSRPWQRRARLRSNNRTLTFAGATADSATADSATAGGVETTNGAAAASAAFLAAARFWQHAARPLDGVSRGASVSWQADPIAERGATATAGLGATQQQRSAQTSADLQPQRRSWQGNGELPAESVGQGSGICEVAAR